MLAGTCAALLAPPAWATGACGSEALFGGGFEALEPADPSYGATDSITGNRTLTVFVAAINQTRTYHVRVPAAYTAGQAWPLVVALHGTPGGPQFADQAARDTRQAWVTRAEGAGFIVLAPVASGPTAGGWNPPDDSFALFAAIADLEARYNIDRRRRYLWGFSGGGHFALGTGLSGATFFAAVGANAGVLASYAGIGAPAAAACRIPIQVRVGSSDPLQVNAFSDRSVFAAAGWVEGIDYQYTEFAAGHTYFTTDIDAHWAFFAPRRRP